MQGPARSDVVHSDASRRRGHSNEKHGMNRLPRTERLPLASRQAVHLLLERERERDRSSRLAMADADNNNNNNNTVDDGEQQGLHHHFAFDYPVLPPPLGSPDAGPSNSRKITSLQGTAHKHAQTEQQQPGPSHSRSRVQSVSASGTAGSSQHQQPSTQASSSHLAAARSESCPILLPLKMVSETKMLVPPTIPPSMPSADSLHNPPRKSRARFLIDRNADELKRTHPSLHAQLSDATLVSLLQQEEKLAEQEALRLRSTGEMGPEGVDEMREPVLEGARTLAACWDHGTRRVLLLVVGDEDGNQLYLHELCNLQPHGLVHTVHDEPIFSGPSRILQVSVCARTSSAYAKALPLFVVIRTMTSTGIWELSLRDPSDGIGINRPQKRKRTTRKAQHELKDRSKHPYEMHRVASLHPIPFENPVPPPAPPPSPPATASRPAPSRKGKERMIDEVEVEAQTEELVEETVTPETPLVPRRSEPPIVNTEWHPTDPFRLLTVDAVGRVGIWVYDPGIHRGRYHLTPIEPEPDVTFPISVGPRPAEHNAEYFQVQWAQRSNIAFRISRTQFSILNTETGSLAVILNLAEAPRLSSIISRPQFIRALSTHADLLNAEACAPSLPTATPTVELIAVLTTVDVFVWDISRLEDFFAAEVAREQAEAARLATGQTRRSGRRRMQESRPNSSTDAVAPPPSVVPPAPQVWWEHVRGQDRSLTLSWIPLSNTAPFRSVVLSSARSRLLVAYTVEMTRRDAGIVVAQSPTRSAESSAHETEDSGVARIMTSSNVHLAALTPAALATGLEPRPSSEIKRPTGPQPFPRSTNPVTFVRFDLPSPQLYRPTRRYSTGQESGTGQVQVLMLEQDARSTVWGSICDCVLPAPSDCGTDSDAARCAEDQSVASSEEDEWELEQQLQVRPPSYSAARMFTSASENLLPAFPLAFGERAPWNRQGPGGEGEQRLLNLNNTRPVPERDNQRERVNVDLRGLYRSLMQIGLELPLWRVVDIEDVVDRAKRSLQMADSMWPALLLPHYFLHAAQRSLRMDISLLKVVSPALSGTLAVSATGLSNNAVLRELLDQFFSALQMDMFHNRPFQVSKHIVPDHSANEEQEVDDEGDSIDGSLSCDGWERLADKLRDLYLGPDSRSGLTSALFVGHAADQLAFDLLLSSVTVTSRQVSVVTGIVESADESEGYSESGVEVFLHRFAEEAGHPTDRLHEWEEEQDAAVVAAAAAESQSQSQSQRRQRSQSQASSRSSRVGDLDGKIDTYLDSVEQKLLPEVGLPFLRPYLLNRDAPRARLATSRTANSSTYSDGPDVPAPISRAARLLLADWTIGEEVNVAQHRNPYEAVPNLLNDEVERVRRQSRRRATSSQPPSAHHQSSSRAHTPATPRAHTPGGPTERIRSSATPAGALGPGVWEGGRFSPGLSQMTGRPVIGAFSGPPRIAASRTEHAMSGPHFAPQTAAERARAGLHGHFDSSHSQQAPTAPGLQSAVSNVVHHHDHDGDQAASQTMLGSSQTTDEQGMMTSTQPVPGRFADRRFTPSMPGKKKVKKKRAGGF
ncbi:hypothetical protein V8E36_007542 [Tilletia maclaganii]